MLFLWDTSTRATNPEIKLRFFDSTEGKIKEISVINYKPYFLAPYPLTKKEVDAVKSVQGEIQTLRKRNLFTDKILTLAKISVWNPSFLKRLEKDFRKVWENEIEFSRSYIYDRGLVFGAPYIQQEERFEIINNIDEDLESQYKETFASEDSHSQKHKLIKEWFNLCHQRVPKIPSKLLQQNNKPVDSIKIYSAFLLSRLTNIPVLEAYSTRRVSNWLRSMIHNYLRKNNILIPTSEELRRGYETHKVPGALTLKPKPGIYFNTVVCDFKSLYPSCIDRYNLSYETIDCSHEECKINIIHEINHHACTKRKGFYSLLIGALKDLRIRWFLPLSSNHSIPEEDRSRAEAASKMLKLIGVSAYGVTIRIHGLACPPLAESITGYGRWVLKATWKIAKELGMQPTYGDTDSIFLDNPSLYQVRTLAIRVKNQLKLELAEEKHYTLCVLSKAKKAYFGIRKDKMPDLKGLTAVKSNAPNFIQRVFRQCVQILMDVSNMKQYVSAKKKIVKAVQDAKKQLMEGKVDLQDLIYSVQLYHEPQERIREKGVMPQPYQCAMQLIDNGEKLARRSIVHFLKVKPFNYKSKTFTVKPFSSVMSFSEINVEDYMRNLTSALEQTFEPMGINMDTEFNKRLTDWFRG